MTDYSAGYLITLENSQREDTDSTIDAIRHIKGVIDVSPVSENIDEHIAEERITNEFSEKFSEFSVSIMKFLSERMNRGKIHRDFYVQMFKVEEYRGSQFYSNRFMELLNFFVFSDDSFLNDKQKVLREKLVEFCGKYLVSYGTEYDIPKWKD